MVSAIFAHSYGSKSSCGPQTPNRLIAISSNATLYRGRSSTRSSSSPTENIATENAVSHINLSCGQLDRLQSSPIATTKPPMIAIPPNCGVGFEWFRSVEGFANAPILLANCLETGTNAQAVKQATSGISPISEYWVNLMAKRTCLGHT